MEEIIPGKEIWICPAICQRMRYGHTPLYALGFNGKVLRINPKTATATVDIQDGGKPLYIDLADIGEAYPVEELLKKLKREWRECTESDMKDRIMRDIGYVEN